MRMFNVMLLKEVYILLRVRDWLKNILIFFPLVFSGLLFEYSNIAFLISGFFIFSLISSFIYVLNDILDIEKDKRHPKKKYEKPLANGKIKISFAYKLLFLLFLLISISIIVFPYILKSIVFYLLISISYNLYLKKIPYFEFTILSLGYVVRIDAGSLLINVESSILMLISTFFLGLFFIILKRVSEINYISEKNISITRHVLMHYQINHLMFLVFFSILIFSITLIIYVVSININLLLSSFLVIIFLIYYLNSTKNTSLGENPIRLILTNRYLFFLSLSILFSSLLIYY